jgi:fucose 4-O-acetylase-like acetyltransferase
MIQALHHCWLLGYFAVTWGLYALGWFLPEQTRLLGMQWEFAFPILLYQVYFTHALAVGYFRQEIAQGLKNASTRWLAVGGAAVLALAFLLAAQTNPNPAFPDWWRLGSLTNEQYRAFHGAWLAKGHPSPLRLLNVAAFFMAFYALLTYLWVPLNRALGWLLIPLGEASLYVFLMHLAFIALIDQIPGYFDESPAWHAVWPVRIWFNTALYVGTILSLWLMLRHKVLFGVVPR